MGNCFSIQFSFENILIRAWDSTVGHANYVCKLKETLLALSAALEELRVQKNDVQREVDLAEQRQLKRLEQVRLWLSKAKTMITEAENLIADGPQQINNLCLGGCVSRNCLSSYKFGKRRRWKDNTLDPINNKFSTTPQGFDIVIWSLVSKDYNVEKIQDRIGGKIGFSDESWKNRSVDQKAEDIYGVLRQKRFVVLLDDLWERVDLNKVGIPKPTQENGSKLIFTTRLKEVCGEMEARHKIKECGGLPLALITIGRAMACKTTPGEWKYAIEKLKRSALPKMENEVFPLLKFRYDYLDPTMKCCLLYCCLYPEDYNIPKMRLVEYWFCEGLLNEFDRISDSQMQGDYIVNSLLSACLLERGGEERVKMHDVIRDMGLWTACEVEEKEQSFFVKSGQSLPNELQFLKKDSSFLTNPLLKNNKEKTNTHNSYSMFETLLLWGLPEMKHILGCPVLHV
ncbi:hypothetical protein F3Y22_tig00016571pilonHSYRG00001 [Hibiscus syriacus]|uniref:Uncharacterized protein n=1 Tax=Hibiscus syriacus TaxID=106335 RepID=A0A6A3BZ38_HIBSY|nr:hypothetical protein F3Y22_tig00016571pilonHSYRG00001 [Hibiscus syriacus]